MWDEDWHHGEVRSTWKMSVYHHDNDTVSNWHPSFVVDAAPCQLPWIVVRFVKLLIDIDTRGVRRVTGTSKDSHYKDSHRFDEATRQGAVGALPVLFIEISDSSMQ